MAVKTEGQHMAEALLYELPHDGSRQNVTVLSGQNLAAGAVVGRVALGVGRVSIPTVVGTGDGTASVVYAGPDVELGNYVLTCTAAVTNGGVFSLVAPSGKALAPLTLTVGAGGSTLYRSSHINFTITDGSTDFAADDVFTFVVSTTVPTVIGGTGTGVMSAISLGPDAKPGRYQVYNRVVIANGGDFEVIGPEGETIGRFNWAAAASTADFTGSQINFTLSDATDYIAGNYFDIAVFNIGERDQGKVVAYTPGTYDGRHRPAGILAAAVDASLADTAGLLIARQAVVNANTLGWAAAVSVAEQQAAQSAMARTLGIVAR